MSLYVLKPKTENKNITQDCMIGTGKNVKVVYSSEKINSQNQNSLRFFLSEFIVSVKFLYFYNLPFAFIHYTFYFNSKSMGFC